MRGLTEDKRRELDYLMLGSVPGMTARVFHRLIQAFGDAGAVLAAAAQDARWGGVSLAMRGRIAAVSRPDCQQQALAALRKTGVRAVTFLNEKYPAPLRDIPDPPAVLYYKGTLPGEWERSVAIVGARKASRYAQDVAEKFGRELAAAGVRVVSGLAWGVDAAAHRGALTGEALPVAVLGCGADVVYPQGNAGLYAQMERAGCILTEYPPGTRPSRENFPMRNRIISGLCCAVIFVEGSLKSGALITVACALEQGKEVFVLPGHSIFDPGCAGGNELLRAGANPIFEVQDVADYLGWGELVAKEAAPTAAIADPVQRRIVECIQAGCGQPELLCERLQLPAQTLLAHLTMLELAGVVRQLPGGAFDIPPR